jgi:diguanylate cyclase (GGDEF)-like protein
MVANIASAAAQPAHRWFAAGLAVLLILSALLAWLGGTMALPILPAFQPMIVAAVMLSGAVTAYLLFGQFMLSGVAALALLAAAYQFNALMSGVHLLLLAGQPGGAAWTWHFWHFGQLLLLIGFALLQAVAPAATLPGRKHLVWPIGITLASVGVAAALALLAILGSPLWRSSDMLAPFAFAATLLGLLLFLAMTGARTLLQLWLAMALLASLLEAALTAVAPPFSLGWYCAGLDGLFAGASLLIAVGHEVTVLYGRLDDLNRRLEQLASIDRLSGLANRRLFDQRFSLEWRRAVRERAPISLAMIDIDWFKRFNDSYGHLQGDQCIRRVSALIAGLARRPSDLVARYGGEEFVVIMGGTDESGAALLAGRIAEAVQAERIPHATNEAAGIVTVSIGISTWRPRQGDHRSWLIEAADHALYAAKHAGRNRVLAGRCTPGVLPGALIAEIGAEEAEDPEIAGVG